MKVRYGKASEVKIVGKIVVFCNGQGWTEQFEGKTRSVLDIFENPFGHPSENAK